MVKIILAIILIYLKIISIYSAGDEEKIGKNADDKYRKEKSSPLNPNSTNRDLSNSAKTTHQYTQLVPYNSHQNNLRKKAMANWIRSKKNVQNLHFQEQGEELRQKKPRRSSQENVINFGGLLVQPVGNFGSHEPFTITAAGDMNFGRQNSAFTLYKSKDRQEEMKRKQQYFHALDSQEKKQGMEKVLHKLTQTAPSNAQHQIVSENDQRQSNSTQFQSTIEFAKWLLSSKKGEGLSMPQRHSLSHQSSQQQQLPILDKKRKGILLESETTNPTAHFLPDNFIQAYPPQHHQNQTAFEALPSNSFSQNEIEKQQRLLTNFNQQHQIQQQLNQKQRQQQNDVPQKHLIQIHLPNQDLMKRAVNHLAEKGIDHPLPDQRFMKRAFDHQIVHQIHHAQQPLIQINLTDQHFMRRAADHLMKENIYHPPPDQNLMDKVINHQIHLAHQYDSIAGQHPIGQQQLKPGDFLKTVRQISQKYANYFKQHDKNIRKLEKGKGKRLFSNVSGDESPLQNWSIPAGKTLMHSSSNALNYWPGGQLQYMGQNVQKDENGTEIGVDNRMAIDDNIGEEESELANMFTSDDRNPSID